MQEAGPAREGAGAEGCPPVAGRASLLEHYSTYFRPGIVDLSSSAAPQPELHLPDLGAEDLDYVPPRGAPELRAAIAARYRTLSADDIVLASGASEALVAIVHALRPASVSVDCGVYESFLAAARRLEIDLTESDEPLPGADMSVVCNPTVPAGRLRQLPAGHARLVVDEVELDFVHAETPAVRAADVSRRAMSVNSLSKSLGLGGLRIGWVATRDASALESIDHEVQLLSGGPAALSVAAALSALEEYDALVGATRSRVEANAPLVYQALDAAGWKFKRPEAGLTVLGYPPRPMDALTIARLAAEGLFVVPGEVYGIAGACRISLLAPAEDLARACRIAGAAGRKQIETPGPGTTPDRNSCPHTLT